MDNNKVFAFDLGGVLLGFDYNIALAKIKGRMQASADKVIEELYYNDFGLSFEKGLLSPEQFYLNFQDSFKSNLTYAEFADIWCDIFFAHEEVINLAERIKKSYPLFLISNINKLHFDYLLEKFPKIFSLFDKLVLSFEVRSVKPEEAIYNALREEAGAEFKDIIYIDDRQDLIDAARNFNLQCIRYTDFNRLINDLKSLDIIT